MQVVVVTLFPQLVEDALQYGVVGRAIERGDVQLGCENPRDYADDRHRTVDDRPYGGGPGMVMRYEPLAEAIDNARRRAPAGSPVVCLTPDGRVFDQAEAARLAALPGMVLVAGRYEGMDQRLVDGKVDVELSLGDFVLSGGEFAALAVIDATVRLLPGVLGDEASAQQDSFVDGLLDHPHYTRPEVVAGRAVPPVLLSGDHAAIARWRYKQALGRSFLKRPDLVRKLQLNAEQRVLLEEFLTECGSASGTGDGNRAGR